MLTLLEDWHIDPCETNSDSRDMFTDHGDRFTVPVICIQILMMDILTMMMGKQTLVIPTLTLVFHVGTDTPGH